MILIILAIAMVGQANNERMQSSDIVFRNGKTNVIGWKYNSAQGGEVHWDIQRSLRATTTNDINTTIGGADFVCKIKSTKLRFCRIANADRTPVKKYKPILTGLRTANSQSGAFEGESVLVRIWFDDQDCIRGCPTSATPSPPAPIPTR